jgi:hypothetical protein
MLPGLSSIQQGKSVPATYCFTRSQVPTSLLLEEYSKKKVLIVLHTLSIVVELHTKLGIHCHIIWILVKYRGIKSTIIVMDATGTISLGNKATLSCAWVTSLLSHIST